MLSPAEAVRARFDPVFRAEYGRTVAGLIRQFGDFDLAEESVGEAIVTALQTWPAQGLPPNPGGWLATTARRKALDRLRRESVGAARHRQAAYLQAIEAEHDRAPDPPERIADDRLRLLFTCCHPALAPEARIALTLRLVGGLTVPEIARAFLLPERTLAQRITRAKRKIADARIPYRVPGPAELPNRLDGVLQVLYLIFNEGYLATAHDGLRDDLAEEAVRLTRELARLMPRHPEVLGLLALQLLALARRPARLDDGALVPLDRQDRSRWDRSLLAEGHALVRACLQLDRPGPFQLQAAIGAVHCDAPTFAATDWAQIVTLYDHLLTLTPSAVVELNRAIAAAELTGPGPALATIDRLGLTGYPEWHAARGDLLARLDRRPEAAEALRAAIGLTGNPAQARFLQARLDRLDRLDLPDLPDRPGD